MATQFLLKQEHIDLLSHANWMETDWGYGGPSINGKYPYLDCGMVDNIHTILGWEYVEDEEDEKRHAECVVRARGIHSELTNALCVILSARSFEPGFYIFDNQTWSRSELT